MGPPKGPVLGPMIICGIVLNRECLEDLRSEGVKDSKAIRPEGREKLAKILEKKAEKIETVSFRAPEIDRMRTNGKNLNRIEEMGFVRIIERLDTPVAYIDAASANAEKFSDKIRKELSKETELVVEHRADEKYIQVSAASIVAKVKRDEMVEKLKEKYGEIGSGYPADSLTIEFLERWMEENSELPECARKTWKTAKRIGSRK